MLGSAFPAQEVRDGKGGRDLQAVWVRGPISRRQLGNACPRLPQRGHGSWYFHCSTTNLLGRSERTRRGGFASRAAARRAMDAFLARSREDQAGEGWSMERWLRYWLSTRTSIRPTTRLHYSRDIERFLCQGRVKTDPQTTAES